MKQRIAILASGDGTNAENIIRFFEDHQHVEVSLVATNKATAGVIERAERLGVEALVFNREQLKDVAGLLAELKTRKIDFVVLAGFLLMIPHHLIEAFPEHMINIHPALLPKFGGKGMYGMHVHRAVKEKGETETGITIHLVNEHYDQGAILFQSKVEVSPGDSPEQIAEKVHQLEYQYYPKVIEQMVRNTSQIDHG
ncbi:phosphoribosylglycinamide formyltransferase [Aureitalea marina]|uniref:Phosphoribosylglycinamide formyltransferase n=1 Tax=Aureitalea marina TaxID=930804 RepID=A0A2S7KRW3_9FLAO|nr:phosphoribosylglycinamide formyltransferase [Aureitalea marina]PQB05356.1 phosphoribosylglycinamide formyltransferase [Aureitalea marina]